MYKPKILIITPARVIGGGEIYLSNLLPQITQHYDVTVLASKSVRKLVQEHVSTKRLPVFPQVIEKLVIRNYKLKKIYYSCYFRLFFAGKSYNLVSLQLFDGALVESIGETPLVLTVQTRFPIPRQHDQYIQSTFKLIDRVICVSRQTKNDLVERGVPAEKCVVVHNGIPVERYSINTKPGAYVTWVGRVEEIDKNPLLFVKIAGLAQSRNLDLKFRIVGSGSYLGELQRYIKQHKIKNIELSGQRSPNDMLQIYREACILCMTSTSEGLPFVALEAMASGVPVVASSVGGLKELVSGPEYGSLVEDLNESVFFSKISKLLADKKMYDNVRKAARSRIEDNFSNASMAQKTQAVYDSLMERK